MTLIPAWRQLGEYSGYHVRHSRHIAIRRGEGENKTDPAKERFRIAAVPGGIMRNKINVTQSRLSFEISLPVLAADKCSIPTTCTRTPHPSNSPSTSTLCRSKEAIKLRRPKNLSQKFITVRRLWHARQPRFSPLFSLSLSLFVFLHTILCVSAISRDTPVKYEQKNIIAKMKNLSTVGRKHSPL